MRNYIYNTDFSVQTPARFRVNVATCLLLDVASLLWIRVSASMASEPTRRSSFDTISYLLFVIYGVLVLTITTCCQSMTNTCRYFLQRAIDILCCPLRFIKAANMKVYTCATSLCRGPCHLFNNIRLTCTDVFRESAQNCRRACLIICNTPEHFKSASAAIAAMPSAVRASTWHFCCSATAAVLGLPGRMVRALCSSVSILLYSILTASFFFTQKIQQLLLTLLPHDWIYAVVALNRLAKLLWYRFQQSYQVVYLLAMQT